MKKVKLLILTGALLFTMTSCGGEEKKPITLDDLSEQNNVESSETVESPNAVEESTASTETIDNTAATLPTESEQEQLQNVTDQMEIIAQNRALWFENPEYMDEVYQYAVTDLNQDGRYEIIVSDFGGTGFYTYSRFFEINENYDGLAECSTNFLEGDSQLDLIGEKADVYYDEASQIFHYIFSDYLRASATEYYGSIRALTLQNGQITEEYLASMSEIHTNSEPFTDENEETVTFTFQDAAGNEMEEASYLATADTVFSGMTKYQATFGWQDMRELVDLSDAELAEKLVKSAESFSVK